MDQYIGPLAFALFVILWAAFALALVTSQGSLDGAWDWIRGQHVIVQAIVWILFLPVVFGLWVWHTDWSLAVRLVLIIGAAAVNLYLFFPKGLFGPKA